MASDLERFEALCASLRRNDPRTTMLGTIFFPDGYGLRLGDALEGNTHVSSMVLRLDNVLADDESVDSAACLLSYISESASMRKIQFPCGLHATRPEVVATLLRLALLAVAESSHIEELSLLRVHHTEVAPPPDAIALLLGTTQSLKTLRISLGDFDGVTSRELVAKAFGANRMLECLVIYFGSGTHTVESVLLHLGSNPGLRELQLCCSSNASVAQIRALNHFLRTTISLEQLELHNYTFNMERMEYFVEGLQSSRSLVKLSVSHFSAISDRASWEVLVRCLPKLVYLRELRIGVGRDLHEDIVARSFVDALAQNGSLQVVNIRGRAFFDEAQDRLIRSYCKRNEAISTLVANPQPDATAIALLPKLFVAAKQARRTAPNSILLGLLFADVAIGPRQDRNKPPLQGPSAQKIVAVGREAV